MALFNYFSCLLSFKVSVTNQKLILTAWLLEMLKVIIFSKQVFLLLNTHDLF